MAGHDDFGGGLTGEALEQLCVNTIRTLSMDGVQKANSGHPGLPMGCADIAHVLFTKFLKFDPADPRWPDRDRFVLSAGHGSMLLYAMLHLCGYDLSMEDLQSFRQWGSRTPGHPEFGLTPGVESTTGPLGQGISNAVGMAIAEEWLAATFNSGDMKPVHHFTYVLASDGDLQEGVQAEAVSLAGHLALGRLIVIYDDNRISIEGDTALSYSDDVETRFKGHHWHVQKVDGHDRAAIEAALRAAREETARPSIIIARTTIAYGSPHAAGTSEAHGSPLGDKEIAATKANLGWPEDAKFLVPDAVRPVFAAAAGRGRKAREAWSAMMDAWRAADPAKAALWDQFHSGALPEDLAAALPVPDPGKAVATRKSGGDALAAMMRAVPNLIGGSADLAPSTNTFVKEFGAFSRENRAGRNFHFGIREHAMGAILNGMCYHGGVRPFGATFFVFSDYMRPPMRLAALTHLNPVYVLTHDSIFVGEDGPTHQPVEHLAALRCIPNMTVIRPADAGEAGQAWLAALQSTNGPTALVLTRQNLPTLDRTRYAPAEGLQRGGYLLAGEGDLTLIATGSEVALALEVRAILEEEYDAATRVVSMPSWELFRRQPEIYQARTLGKGPRVALEAGVGMGWEKWLGHDGLFIGIDRFGASAPHQRLAKEYGLDARTIVELRIVPWLRQSSTVCIDKKKK